MPRYHTQPLHFLLTPGVVLTVTNSLTLISAAGHGSRFSTLEMSRKHRSAVRLLAARCAGTLLESTNKNGTHMGAHFCTRALARSRNLQFQYPNWIIYSFLINYLNRASTRVTAFSFAIATEKPYAWREHRKNRLSPAISFCADNAWLSELFSSRYDIRIAIQRLDELFV